MCKMNNRVIRKRYTLGSTWKNRGNSCFQEFPGMWDSTLNQNLDAEEEFLIVLKYETFFLNIVFTKSKT